MGKEKKKRKEKTDTYHTFIATPMSHIYSMIMMRNDAEKIGSEEGRFRTNIAFKKMSLAT
jgi:hypothetical protein